MKSFVKYTLNSEEVKVLSRHEDDLDMWWGLKWFLIFVVVVLLVGSAVWIIGLGARPWEMNVQREQNTNSQQHVSGQVALLEQKHNAYQDLELEIDNLRENGADPARITQREARQQAYLVEMHDRAGRLPEGTVPPHIAQFLADNPRR